MYSSEAKSERYRRVGVWLLLVIVALWRLDWEKPPPFGGGSSLETGADTGSARLHGRRLNDGSVHDERKERLTGGGRGKELPEGNGGGLPEAGQASTGTNPDFERGPFRMWTDSAKRYRVVFSLPRFEVVEDLARGAGGRRVLAAGTTGRLKVAGRPELPVYRTDIQLPAATRAVVTLVSASTSRMRLDTPRLSQGFMERQNVEGNKIRERHGTGELFPEKLARLTRPYQIGSSRGIGLIVHPFQYSAGMSTLFVRDQIELIIDLVGVEPGAADTGDAPPSRYSEVERSAWSRYINTAGGESFATVYAGADGTRGSSQDVLLIVVPDAWVDGITDLADWKRRRGMDVRVARYPSDTGSGAAALSTYIAQRYAEEGTSHIILVGDSDDIPVAKSSPNPSDTVYTLLEGDDLYHDAFISRVSAETLEQVGNQVTKFIGYERYPDAGEDGDWYAKALFVASNEGAGKSAFGLDDRDILDIERDQLLSSGFTHIDQVYDPGASLAAVVSAWNEGRSYVLYLGHGEYTSWRTTRFGVSDAFALANGSALPMVVNGSCYNGNFTLSYDSLGEAMMRAGESGSPAGAIGVIAATTAADWDPPIVLLQQFNELIETDSPLGSGGFTFQSIQAAMDYCYQTPDEGESAARKLMEQMHLLGDCTLGLRTRPPSAPTVSHSGLVLPGSPFPVSVSNDEGRGIAGAVVCLSRPEGVQVTSVTDSEGQAVLNVPEFGEDAIAEGFDLCVYARNLVPYEAVLSAEPEVLTVVSQAELATAIVGEPYNFQLRGAGGTPPYRWQLGTQAPEWLQLDGDTGALTGRVEVTGEHQFQVVLADNSGETVHQDARLTAGEAVSIIKTPPPLAMVAETYEEQIHCRGSFAPFVLSLTGGVLPTGLALTEDGLLEGAPLISGTFPVTFEALDSVGRIDTFETVMEVSPSPTVHILTPRRLENGYLGAEYELTFSAEGGTGAGYTWTVTAGHLPAGLELLADGEVIGTAEEWGEFVFRVHVADDHQPPHTGEALFAMAVDAPVRFATTQLPAGRVGAAYRGVLTAEGTFPPFHYSSNNGEGGYSYSEAAASMSWDDLQSPTWVGDEQEWPLQLGFEFKFYDTVYEQCRVGDNGYVILEGQLPGQKWDANEDDFKSQYMIAPFWNDLLIGPDQPGTGIWVETLPGAVKIRWRGRDYHSVEEVIETGLTLKSNGDIVFHYGGISTTNRTVIGIAAGQGTAQVLATHEYNKIAPVKLGGWDAHPDIVWSVSGANPVWLEILPDGNLSGTPAQAGQFEVNAKVTDAAGNVDTLVLPLIVGDLHPADSDGDGDITNSELLGFIDLVDDGRFPEADLDQAIEMWRNPTGPSPDRGLWEGLGERGSGVVGRRRLPAPGFIAGRAAVMRYDLAHESDDAARACIVGELGGWTNSSEAFIVKSGKPSFGLPVRTDENGVFWLIQEPRLDGLVVYARVEPSPRVRGEIELSGILQTSRGANVPAGANAWPEAQVEEVSVSLQAGWNAVALPLLLEDDSPAALLSDVAYEAPVWQWDGESFSEADRIMPGRGYWIKCSTAGELIATGVRETDILATYGEGWQLAGTYSRISLPLVEGVSRAWLWDPVSQRFGKARFSPESAAVWLLLSAEWMLDLCYE